MRRRIILAVTIAAPLLGDVSRRPSHSRSCRRRSRAHEVQAQQTPAGGTVIVKVINWRRPISSSCRRPRAARQTGRKC